MSNNVKIVTRRDSATAILRKLGIHRDSYHVYIKELTDGRFMVDVGRVEALKAGKGPKPPTKTTGDDTPRSRFGGLAQTIRDMIRQGLSNDEIKTKLNLPPEKHHYPSWYRCQLNKAG